MTLWQRFPVMAPDDGGAGSGGAGGTDGGAAGGGAGGADGGSGGAKEPTLAEVQDALKAMQAKVVDLEAAKTKSDQAADEARRSALSEQDRIKEDRTRLDEEKATLRQERRDGALDKLGVLAKYRKMAPDVDPRDPAGAAELEKWAGANPELISKPAGGQQTPVVPEASALGQILKGVKSHPLINLDSLKNMLRGG